MERKSIIADNAKKTQKPRGAAVLQESVTNAIEKALFREWAERGYSGISLERVAKNAGVGKAAIYRRWNSKLDLVSHALTRSGVALAFAPDTGSLRGDIVALLQHLRKTMRHPIVARILPDLHAEMPRTPELAHVVRAELQAYRRSKGDIILRNAIDRGELPSTLNIDLATDMLGSMLYWRMLITRQKADQAYMNDLTNFMMRALKSQNG